LVRGNDLFEEIDDLRIGFRSLPGLADNVGINQIHQALARSIPRARSPRRHQPPAWKQEPLQNSACAGRNKIVSLVAPDGHRQGLEEKQIRPYFVE
jgi:hypothetical protein